MTLGGIIVIIAGLALGFAGWAAAVYSTNQISQRRAEKSTATSQVDAPDAVYREPGRSISIDIHGDFVMAARRSEAGLARELERSRSTAKMLERSNSTPRIGGHSLKLPVDPGTGKIFAFEDLPRKVEPE